MKINIKISLLRDRLSQMLQIYIYIYDPTLCLCFSWSEGLIFFRGIAKLKIFYANVIKENKHVIKSYKIILKHNILGVINRKTH